MDYLDEDDLPSAAAYNRARGQERNAMRELVEEEGAIYNEVVAAYSTGKATYASVKSAWKLFLLKVCEVPASEGLCPDRKQMALYTLPPEPAPKKTWAQVAGGK
jgi:hypothetical protein